MNDPLIYARAVHFAATVTVAGTAFFVVLIAAPAFRNARHDTRAPATVWRWLTWIAWISLALAVASGAAWLVLLAQSMSDGALPEVFSEDILWIVLLQTGFGRDWLARFMLACLLAAVFVRLFSARGVKSASLRIAVVASAAGLVGSLAWAGHAAGGSDFEAIVHPAADFLHLVAAAAWIGMLVPLAVLLAAAGNDVAAVAIARTAIVRFSACGIGGVGTLLVTGSINTFYLAGSFTALADTEYGRLLLMKIALFLGMVAIAAVNRLRLMPRLAHDADASVAQDALRQLRRNTVIEVAVGAIIIAIVAVLGVTPPGLHAPPLTGIDWGERAK